MQIITKITPGSIAEELNIKPGSKLIRVNGQEVEDVFDYRFMISDEYVELEIETPEGRLDTYPIEKDEYEEMGLEFEDGLMDDYRRCSNNCIFCFIDQMPPGMRETLYFKDDDSRLSFLQGNYITLTNMKQADIDRIIRYHMSPINISVHTTNPKLRCEMLHNRFAGDVLSYLEQLYEADIVMNGQIVLCKGINDGDELRRTIEDLMKYAPVMESVSIVPVGMTKFRDGLYPLEPIEAADAAAVIDIVESYQGKCFEEYGVHFIHASDEFYLLAGREMPEEERYDGYLQLENGVGMMRLLHEEFINALAEYSSSFYDDTDIINDEVTAAFADHTLYDENEDMPAEKTNGLDENCKVKEAVHTSVKGVCTEDIRIDDNRQNRRKISIATGKLAFQTIDDLVKLAQRTLKPTSYKLPEIEVNMITNNFFGERITVSGLICGCDLIEQLKNKDLGSELLLPVNMLRSGEEYFLDDITVKELENELKVKVVIVPSDGASLLKALLGEEMNEIGGRQIYEQADSSDSWTS